MDSSDSELDIDTVRKTYLITYSQADLKRFPTRESFGKCVVEAFSLGKTKSRLLHWVCSQEAHKDGKKHYHVALKFDSNVRWKAAKVYMYNNKGISVHFSDKHYGYYAAYNYAVKYDKEPFLSPGHPNLPDAKYPKTKICSQALRRSTALKRKSLQNESEPTPSTSGVSSSQGSKKMKRLSNFEVSEYLLKNSIKNDTELLALANVQKEEGKTDLAEFILKKTPKALNELIACTWRMQEAPSRIDRANKSRFEVIVETVDKDCVPQCGGEWLVCAKQVLRNNKIHPFVFADALRNLLVKGRGKYRNIFICGPANCGKTFLLEPLLKIFHTFSNPATKTYAWLGVEDAEIILLNDFRWSAGLISWNDLLLLLEGQGVHFPAPKSQYARDIYLDKDTPVLATSKAPIVHMGRFGIEDQRETEMMTARWRFFSFHHQIDEREQKELVPCPSCFCTLVMLGADEQ